jgi:DNA-binding transcriptional LysR family regulator
VQTLPLGEVEFVFVVAPHHPLARVKGPITDDVRQKHRAVAVADSVQRGVAATYSLLAGQDVLTVPTMAAKLDAQLRGLGGGFVPEPLARPHIERGTLVAKEVERNQRMVRLSYSWRTNPPPGRGLQWWLKQLESAATRKAMLFRHHHP